MPTLATGAAIAVLIGLLLVANGSSAGAAGSTLTPVADAHVRADRSGSNFGRGTGLRVDGSPIANAYLRFHVSVPSGDVVTSAKLRVYTTSSSRSGITVHGVSSNG